MKGPEEVVADVTRHLRTNWHLEIVGGSLWWPRTYSLGLPRTQAELEAVFTDVAEQADRIRAWAHKHGLRAEEKLRKVFTSTQTLPTGVSVESVDVAARVAGPEWVDRLARARQRAEVLAATLPHLAERTARLLRDLDSYSGVDFDLACRTAVFFTDPANRERRWTTRQVPVEGLHTKWLDSRRRLIARLAGVEDLGLQIDHPPRIHFTYLDPTYRASGGRVHDSASVGDAVVLPYKPKVVVISENKDTAVWFPPIRGGVAVEGVGSGGGTHAQFGWIRDAPLVFYWGDMDADGLEILNGFRLVGINALSLFMDLDAYREFSRFGVNVDKSGNELTSRPPKDVKKLETGEKDLYLALCSPGWDGPRRVEQERIPIERAATTVRSLAVVMT